MTSYRSTPSRPGGQVTGDVISPLLLFVVVVVVVVVVAAAAASK